MKILFQPSEPEMEWAGTRGQCSQCGTAVELESRDEPVETLLWDSDRNSPVYKVICPNCRHYIRCWRME